MRYSDSERIQLVADNQFGEFYFYVLKSKLEEFLEEHYFNATLDDFLNVYKVEDGRKVLNWLKNQTDSAIVDELEVPE